MSGGLCMSTTARTFDSQGCHQVLGDFVLLVFVFLRGWLGGRAGLVWDRVAELAGGVGVLDQISAPGGVAFLLEYRAGCLFILLALAGLGSSGGSVPFASRRRLSVDCTVFLESFPSKLGGQGLSLSPHRLLRGRQVGGRVVFRQRGEGFVVPGGGTRNNLELSTA